jgi:Zn-dependent protease with chaperone function
MIKALEKLKHLSVKRKGEITKQDEFSTLKISGGKNILRLFSSHPNLDERIIRLKKII